MYAANSGLESDENRNVANNPFLMNNKPFESMNGNRNGNCDEPTTNLLNNNTVLDNDKSENQNQNPFFQSSNTATVNSDMNAIRDGFSNIQLQARPETLGQQKPPNMMPPVQTQSYKPSTMSSQQFVIPPFQAQNHLSSANQQQMPPITQFQMASNQQPPISQQQNNASLLPPQKVPRPPLEQPLHQSSQQPMMPPINQKSLTSPMAQLHQIPQPSQQPMMPQLHQFPAPPSSLNQPQPQQQKPLSDYNAAQQQPYSSSPMMPPMLPVPAQTVNNFQTSNNLLKKKYPPMSQQQPTAFHQQSQLPPPQSLQQYQPQQHQSPLLQPPLQQQQQQPPPLQPPLQQQQPPTLKPPLQQQQQQPPPLQPHMLQSPLQQQQQQPPPLKPPLQQQQQQPPPLQPHMLQSPLQQQQQQPPPLQPHMLQPPLQHQQPPPLQPQLQQQQQVPYPDNLTSSIQQSPGLQYPQYSQQPQPRKLDADQLPSPLQVINDDQERRSGVFCTNQRGLMPPLVTTDFYVQDEGNANPIFIRSTMYSIPNNKDMKKQSCVPLALVVSPMATLRSDESSVPVVDCRQVNPVRCNRCKAYMSPNMQFIDSGHRFHCLMCKVVSDVGDEYFQHLDHMGFRVDRFQRPELMYGSYEFLVGKEYYSREPKPPAYIFLIDVSYNNVKSGLVHLICKNMKHILSNLPIEDDANESSVKVGFITYNKAVHFYNLKESLSQPQMHIVTDVHEMFMPLVDGFLCDVNLSSNLIDQLMLEIPKMFCNTQETETVLLPAIEAGLEAVKAYECPAKLYVFHSSLPISNVPGQLQTRDDRKLLGSDKEHSVLKPQTNAYSKLGKECVKGGCSVDLFLAHNSYIDIATIGQVPKLTGGQIYKYTYFQAENDGERLINDLIMNLRRPIAFDAVMRIRTSTGIHPSDFYGHIYMENPTEVEFAAIDCTKAIAVEIEYDDKLSENEGAVIQVALLYTSVGGFRKVRVHNLTLNVCSDMNELFRVCELNTLMTYFSKQAVHRLLENNCNFVTAGLFSRCSQILASYRKTCAKSNQMGQLILPDSLKLLPLYINCLVKNDAISGGPDITIDEKSFLIHHVLTMDVLLSVSYLYPRVFALHEIEFDGDETKSPPMVRGQFSKIMDDGIYLLENGIHMLIWVGSNVSQMLLQKIFNVNTFQQIPECLNSLPKCDDSDLSTVIHDFIHNLRQESNRHMRLTVVKQRDKLEPVFQLYLVEDRGRGKSQNYVDFVCNVHKEIRSLIS